MNGRPSQYGMFGAKTPKLDASTRGILREIHSPYDELAPNPNLYQGSKISATNELMQQVNAAEIESAAYYNRLHNDTVSQTLEAMSIIVDLSGGNIVMASVGIDLLKGINQDVRTLIYGDNIDRRNLLSFYVAQSVMGAGLNLAAGIGVKAAGAVLGKVAVGASKFAEYGRLWSSSTGAWESLAGQRGAIGGESVALRQHVLANISKSRAAREVSNFPVLAANEDQILGGYNVDNWTMTTLKKGDVVYGGLPGQSNFYTTLDSVLGSDGDRNILGKALQVKPHVKYGYRPDIGEYILTKDVRVPMGTVNSNPHLGVGNSTQFFINKNSNILRLNNEYSLESFYEFNMSRNQYRY